VGCGLTLAVLPRSFFDRPAFEVAPELLGHVIEHETAEGLVAVRLTEVEAYAGTADAASHAYRGPTNRNAVMFGPPGHAYVYFTYGMHFCVNLVCASSGTAAAVLLRAGQVIAGDPLARARRARDGTARNSAARNSAARNSTAGNSTAGNSTAGNSTAGNSAAGNSAAGNSAAGNSAAGNSAAGNSTAGNSTAGERDLARGPARLCQALAIDRALDGADVCDPASPLRVRVGEPVSRRVIRSGPRTGVRCAAEVPWRFWVAGEPTVSPYRAYVPRVRPARGTASTHR
jgi:DNA-3-methyladenine glycosylase